VKEKEYNSPDSFLVSLKNKISVALGIDPHRLNLLIGQFVDQTLPELDSVRKDTSGQISLASLLKIK